jgi:hypothetical protein
VPGQAEGLFRQWFRLHTVLTVVAVLFAFYQLYFDRLSLYTIWFVVAVLNSVTAGKWGAGKLLRHRHCRQLHSHRPRLQPAAHLGQNRHSPFQFTIKYSPSGCS